MIRVTVNGETRELVTGETLHSLVQKLDLPADRLAIELDRKIIKPVHWPETLIRDGAEIEIVHFVGGG